ncbi:beta-glucosidase [Fontibacillus phaseoli]|uniref:Beta-glucosidase n=1 Tax=Fontibacillus phaseoli TaxID=1416533 RepID=A0A369BGS1_9BACL|nr:glycoside hydrolase family 3 N-terminal domain-containing protein [Fontibacillus phaseoli]RCX20611.1 beta-glucosidase [Fontibacillus phaseoli]
MKKKTKRVVKLLRSIFLSLLAVIVVAVMFASNTMLAKNERMVNNVLGRHQSIDSSKANSEGLDLNYNKSDYTKDEIAKAEEELNMKVAGEGIVLLKNDDNTMPFDKGTKFSFLSANSKTFIEMSQLAKIAKPSGHVTSLKAGFESRGFSVNEKLWDFYTKGKGKDYGLGKGSVSFGNDEDFSINEAPLSMIKSEEGLVESLEGTVPVFVLRRVAGEGRDMPRSMYNHTDKIEDQSKSYLEPDSVELEVLQYLNEHFEDVVLLVNSNAAIELGWLEQFPNIRSVVYAPSVGSVGINALADIFAGNINPSGRTIDTFAADALASPAAQNFGSYLYHTEDGQETKYNYVSYKEGIYVGYKYYETRYEDVVLGQGNAGNFDYTSEVVYPFGYGLSYTTFEWANYQNSWDGTKATVKVDVTNTGEVAGKDIVQVYVQSPYTEYDKNNKIEKSSVSLVGYGKTDLLEPGQTETVTITFDQEQLKAYDYVNAKTYILDAGTYYVTAAKDAHNAINNVLAVKGKAVSNGMTADGNKDMVATYTPANTEVDSTTYAKDTATGTEIKNQFDEADGGLDYLTRNDWEGTFPTHDGMVSEKISTWGNEINGTDQEGNPASYQYYKTIDNVLLAKMDSTDSLSPVDASSFNDKIVYGAKNNLNLIDMRGLDFDDPRWDDLLDQLTPDDYQMLITQSGYGVPRLDSINSPFSLDADNTSGLVYGGTGMVFQNNIILAQTWNVNLAEEFGKMIGNEAILGGTNGWYAPAMNIHRTPFSGRNGEYYSEDPFLSGNVGAATTYGVAQKGVYAYLKHFALNDQENHRGDTKGQFSMATWSNEQAIREIYLKPFEMSLKAGNVNLNYVQKNEEGVFENKSREVPAGQAVMTAFNRIGYTWTGGHYPLITGVLRNEWGFKGFVLTDNANTGEFMDAYQMLESGADGKLTNIPEGARYTFKESDVAHYHYGREAMKRMLYTIANSKAMNGAMPGSIFNNDIQKAQIIQISINVVGGAYLAFMAYFIYRKFRRKKRLHVVME